MPSLILDVPAAPAHDCFESNPVRLPGLVASFLLVFAILTISQGLVAFVPEVAGCFAGLDPLDMSRQTFGHAVLLKWNVMFFYPFTVFHLLSPGESPWLYFNLFHYAVGAAGVYLATLRWTGNHRLAIGFGITASLAPFIPDLFYNPSIVAALAWVPWLLMLSQEALTKGGRQLVLWAALGALQLLTGCLEIIALTWICLALSGAATWLTPGGLLVLKRLSGFALLAFLLAATQVLPLMNVEPAPARSPGNSDVDVEHDQRPVLVQVDSGWFRI